MASNVEQQGVIMYEIDLKAQGSLIVPELCCDSGNSVILS